MHKNVCKRSIAFILSLVLLFEIALPTYADEQIIENIIENAKEHNDDCCDHDHDHDHDIHNEISSETNLEKDMINDGEVTSQIVKNEISSEKNDDTKTIILNEVKEEQEETKEIVEIEDEIIPFSFTPVSFLDMPMAMTLAMPLGANLLDAYNANDICNGKHTFVKAKCTDTFETCSKCGETRACASQEHSYVGNKGAEREDDNYHVIYCDKCNYSKKVAHTYTKKRDIRNKDCIYHTYKCDYCEHEVIEKHDVEKEGWWIFSTSKCTICGAKKSNIKHNYVIDPNGEITYDKHTVKCTGCGETKTEEHKFTGNPEICACGCSQISRKLSDGRTAKHRYIVNKDDCTETVYCLAIHNTGSDYCSEPTLTFNNKEHSLKYSNITADTHDAGCEYCNYKVTEMHEYDEKTGKCVCGKDRPPCDHEYVFVKTDENIHTGTCKHCDKQYTENHKYDEGTITKEPTCIEKGIKEFRCTKCDAAKEEEIDALGHDYETTFTEDRAATCTETGTESRHCKNCSATTDEKVVPAKGHKFGDWKVTIEPTCTQTGVQERKCERCSEVETKIIPVKEHDYSLEYKTDLEPTCTETGTESRHCKNCSATTDEKVVPAKGHTFGDWEVVTKETCTTDGSEKRICSACDKEETRIREKTGHNFASDFYIEKDSTCVEKGLKYKKCLNEGCSEVAERSEIDLKPHVYGEWTTTKDSTCEEKGTEERVCINCKVAKETREKTEKGHDFAREFTRDVEPTCTQEGSMSRHCSRCDAKTEITALEKLPHPYGPEKVVDATCTTEGSKTKICAVCGDVHVEVIPALRHDFAREFTRDLEPTCTEDGSKSKHCSRCDAKDEITTIEKLGHDLGEYILDKAATCEEDGKEHRECSRCSYVEEEVIPALRHDFARKFTIDVEPTCTEDGSKSKHCSRCDAKDEITTIEKLGHDLGEYILDKAATCEEDGKEHRECSRCSYEEEEVIPALGHNFAEEFTIDKKANMSVDGLKSHHCTRTGCDKKSDETIIPKYELTFEDKEVTYDGNAHDIKVNGTLPQGSVVSYKIFNNETEVQAAIEVGEYNFIATIAENDEYEQVQLRAKLTIKKADFDRRTLEAQFASKSYVYDGTEKQIVIDEGILPSGTTVTYNNNTRTNVGVSNATATLTNPNYNEQALNATLTITNARFGNEIEGIFNDKTVTYDGTEKTIELDRIPEGASVTYENNKHTNAGSYVATATLSKPNYESVQLEATLTIEEAEFDRETVRAMFPNKFVTYNGQEQKIELAFLPEGATATYLYNTRKDVGPTLANVTVTKPNYKTKKLSASLVINPMEITLDPALIGNIEKTFDKTNTAIFDNGVDTKVVEVDGANGEKVEVTISGTYANKFADSNVALTASITDTNYTLTNTSIEVEGKINPIKLEDGTFDNIDLARGLTDLETIKNQVSDKAKDNRKELEDKEIEGLQIEEEITIEPSKGYGVLTPALEILNGYVLDGDNKYLVITKNVLGNVIYNKTSSSRRRKDNDDKKTEEIDDEDVAQGLNDFEFIDLPKNEVTTSDWAKDDVYDLVAKGIIKGYEDMTYRPLNFIRRDEFAKLAYMTLNIKEDPNGIVKNYLDTINNWAKEEIRIATTNDVLRGYSDTLFGPEDSITNEQIMAILMRGLKYLGLKKETLNSNDIEKEFAKVTDSHLVSDWAEVDVAESIRYGLFIGDENKAIKPTEYTTRAQIAVIMERYLKLIESLTK